MNKNQLKNLENLIDFLSKNEKKVIIMDEPYFFDQNIGKIYERDILLSNNFNIEKYFSRNSLIELTLYSPLFNEFDKNSVPLSIYSGTPGSVKNFAHICGWGPA